MKRYFYSGPISDELHPNTEVVLGEGEPRTHVLLALGVLKEVVSDTEATKAPEPEPQPETAAEPAPVEDAPPRSKKPASKKTSDEAPKTQRAPRSRRGKGG